MGFGERIKDKWPSLLLFSAISIMFLSFCIVSAYTYSNVVQAQTTIVFENPVEEASLLDNGTLEISLSIDIANPSDFKLHTITISWYAEVDLENGQAETIIVGEWYLGSGRQMEIPADDVTTLTFIDYLSPVEDAEKYSKISDFIDYSASQGEDYTFETLPYRHELTVTAQIGDFKNDYMRDFYLNQLVTIELRYVTGEGQ